MYQLNLTEFTLEEFLRDYWQQKPVVIRQGFKDFKDPIAADEIAGLAAEDTVESRLVYKDGDDWQAEFGPFQDYERLGDKGWSLIVQALDNWSEEAAQLIEPFRFIPHWRLDDLMVSFATPGGGVGPHIDLYDVFICQGSGKRHWRVGDRGEHREFAAHEALLHVDPFEPILDVELEAGDILYIPPGFPHDGITLETSLSFSVGFRTNSTASLYSGLADFLIDNELGNDLIEDPGRTKRQHSGAIDNKDLNLIKSHFEHLLADERLFKRFVGSFMTQAKHELDLQIDEDGYSSDDIKQALSQYPLMRLGGLRAFYFPQNLYSGQCFIDGSEENFAREIAPIVQLMCDNVKVETEQLEPWLANPAFIDFIEKQLNAGYWYFAEQ